MRYEVTTRGGHWEALGAHSGWRVRLSASHGDVPNTWAVRVHVRGSESEDEVEVPVPAGREPLHEPTEAFDTGWRCATAWIDAQDEKV